MNHPIIFTDFHHSSLLNSLILLFEKRLKGTCLRPIGVEWFEKGFWDIYRHPATVQQYLGIGGATPDGSAQLNLLSATGDVFDEHKKTEGLYFCQDIVSGQYNKAITFDAFLKLPIDIVIASIPQHLEPFKKLCAIHPSRPKLIFQIGNQWDGRNTALNIMASAKMLPIEGVNFISYHQEFDLDIFKPEGPTMGFPSGDILWPEKNIFSFVNCFDIQDHFKYDWQLFQEIEKLMPDWNFKVYGGQCRNGPVGPASEVAKRMAQARFIWHTKAGGDGYGHVIHNIAAVGRPMIVRRMYYQGKMAEPLIKDGETAIVIDGLNNQEIVNKINYYNDPERYGKLCENAYKNFKNIVDFDKEAEQIKDFLTRLQ